MTFNQCLLRLQRDIDFHLYYNINFRFISNNNNMFKEVCLLLGFLVLVIFCWLFHGDPNLKFIYDFALIGIGVIGTSIWQNKDKLILRAKTLVNGNSQLRATFSYLIKVSIKDSNNLDRHLLVWNEKIKGFQPPGGVYKYYNQEPLINLGANDDDKMHKENDLRLIINRKKYPRLLNWFESGENRERGQEREFYEELIESKILPREIFPFGEFKLIKKYRSPIKYSDHFDLHEIKYFEVYELILNEDQNNYLSKLIPSSSNKYRFVTSEEIKRKGFSRETNKDESRILEQTSLLIKNTIS